MKQKFSASIWQEGGWFIAQCVQVDIASQGASEDEALENLREALELHFSPPVASLVPNIRDVEVDIRAA
ncbi:MAG TPA: type II toxin-antitoxin system HicB family antitoxin [Pyrinomonadaceae bacterium]|nr:type II toxin-antitoxin system HicB family antitoxin [Pyrinomonadaceae bacterium]